MQRNSKRKNKIGKNHYQSKSHFKHLIKYSIKLINIKGTNTFSIKMVNRLSKVGIMYIEKC